MLQVLSQLGVVIFLFLIGLDLDIGQLKSRGKSTATIGAASIAVPFALGMAVTPWLWSRVPGSSAGLLAPMLFMGAAMGITAFPVLARILTERNLHRSTVGVVSIACAAMNDLAAWCILAVVVAVARPYSGLDQAGITALSAIGYLAVMVGLVRPFLGRLQMVFEQRGRLGQGLVAVILLLLLASAYITERIGIHALFGAFVLGFVMPKGTAFVRHLSEKFEDFVVVFLLPLFFAYTGLNTKITLLASPGLLGVTVVIVLVACVGKFGGTALAARATGLAWRESSAIGILMNTRGLMELVILNVGRELKVIGDEVFAMMVVMAIVTTAMTSPLLGWLVPARGAAAGRKAAGAFSVMIPVSLPRSGGPLVQLADALMGPARQAGRLVALHLRPPVTHDAFEAPQPPQDEAARDEAMAPLLAQAKARELPVEALSFVSGDVAADIAATAESRGVDLVLMGFHNPVFGKSLLGGTVHRVMSACPAHVAVFVDRGFRTAGTILVPYLGSAHDQLALELAARMARNTGAQVQVLYVAPPMRGGGNRLDEAKATVQRTFEDPGVQRSAVFKVVEDQSPVGVILHQAQQFDLVIIGVAEEWGLESRLFGWRPETIARDSPASLLIVRRFEGKSGVLAAAAPSVDASVNQTATNCG